MMVSIRFIRSVASLLFAALACSHSMPTIAQAGSAQFTVNGRMKVDGSDLSGARVVVYRNGSKERTITTNLNRFSLDLALNSNYVLSFEKDGFVAKKLQFDTRLPSSAIAREYAPFEFAVSLFKQYDDVNIVVFNQPVGKIRYEPAVDDFDYDTDYTKSIQSQLQQALADVEKKQKEEARVAAAEAKQKAADLKAQAKAEAEAKKLDEARAREEQVRVAEAARAEQARIEAVAKAEQERKDIAQRDQEQRKAAELKVAATPPMPPAQAAAPVHRPMPSPVIEAKREAPAARMDARTSTAPAHEAQDQRRSTTPNLVEEPSPVVKARPVLRAESPEFPERIAEQPVRWEELIVEPTKVMTVIRLELGGSEAEYRKVTHKWGDTFYFKNGATCSRQVYEKEALAGRESADERLVDMAPRGR